MQLNFAPIRDRSIFPKESGGDYGALLGFQNRPGRRFEDVDITSMTVDELIDFADSKGDYAAYSRGAVGRMATPMGGYQIVGTTLKGLRDQGKIPGDAVFDQTTQDYLGQVILEQQGSGAWEGWRGKSIRPGQFKAPPSLEAYKAQKGLNVPNEYIQMIEEANRVQPLPVDTSMQGLFDTPSLPGIDGGVPTSRDGVPVARRENPANPQFSDNAVGNLANRDFGYQTARSVDDLVRAIGGPEAAPQGAAEPSVSAQDVSRIQERNRREAAANPTVQPYTGPGALADPSASARGQASTGIAPQATAAANVGGLFSDQPTDFSAVQPTMSDTLELGTPISGEQAPSLGPSQRLGPRRIAEPEPVPQRDFDQTFGLFDAPMASVATNDAVPTAPVAPAPQATSPLQPLAPAQSVPQRQVADPQPRTLDLVPNAAQSVADNVASYGLFGDAGDGFSYGYSGLSPSGVARVHDSADEQTKIAATGPGLFGAFNKEFGTNIGLGPRTMMSPLAGALGAGAATLGLGPLALAIPAANMLGGTRWLNDRLDVVPRSQRRQEPQPQRGPSLMSRLFGGNPLQGFAGGLFDQARQEASGLFGRGGNSGPTSFNGPIGRNESNLNPANLTPEARREIERATRGIY